MPRLKKRSSSNKCVIPPLVARMPSLAEASIGHELTADALVMGFAATVSAYAKALAA